MNKLVTAAAIACIILAGCASGASPQSQAANVTQAIYNDDVPGVTSHLERGVSAMVAPAQVRLLSRKMHALGAYRGLRPGNYDGVRIPAVKSRDEYVYQAAFAKGTMFVVVRLARDGKLLAYRVMP